MDSNHRSPVAIGQVRTPEDRSAGRKSLHSLGLGILFNAGAYVWTSEIGEVFAASTPARRLETRAWPRPLHDSAMDLALEADRVHHRPDVNLPRGTGSSSPPPSSGESAANLRRGGEGSLHVVRTFPRGFAAAPASAHLHRMRSQPTSKRQSELSEQISITPWSSGSRSVSAAACSGAAAGDPRATAGAAHPEPCVEANYPSGPGSSASPSGSCDGAN